MAWARQSGAGWKGSRDLTPSLGTSRPPLSPLVGKGCGAKTNSCVHSVGARRASSPTCTLMWFVQGRAWDSWTSICKTKKKTSHTPYFPLKLTLKWIVVTNVKCKPVRLLGDTGENVCDFGLGQEFLDTKSITKKLIIN